LSGFLITGILWDGFHREHWWRNFYIRRSLRIFPLYYLALLLALIIVFTVDAGKGRPALLLLYSFYLQNVPALAAHFHQFPHVWLDHFWSLAVEEQFYLIWPFLLFAVRGKNRRFALALYASGWALSLLFRVSIFAFHLSADWATAFLAGRAGELCAGAFLAILIRGTSAQAERVLRNAPLIAAGGAMALVLILALCRSTSPQNALIGTCGISAFSILFTGIVASCLSPNLIQRAFSARWLRQLGKISYGFYVYHLLLRAQFTWIATHLVPHQSRDASLAMTALVAGVGTLIIASVSFYTYESFFLHLKKRFEISVPVSLNTATGPTEDELQNIAG